MAIVQSIFYLPIFIYTEFRGHKTEAFATNTQEGFVLI